MRLLGGRGGGEAPAAATGRQLAVAVEVGPADQERLGDAATRLAREGDEQDQGGGAVGDRGGDGGAGDAPARNQYPVEADVDPERGRGRSDVDLLAVPAREVP